MKRWGWLLCCWLLAGCMSLAADGKPERLPEAAVKQTEAKPLPKDIHLVALGDSLTEGVGDGEGKGGYVGRLVPLLSAEEGVRTVTVANFGKRGRRIAELEPVINAHQDELQRADLILLTIGGNDVMNVVRSHFFDLSRQRFQQAAERFAGRLDHLLIALRTINPDAVILLIGLYNPFSTTLPNIPEIDDVIAEWNKASQAVLSRYDRTMFVDIQDIFADRDDLLYRDEFHPNAAGYEQMAMRVYEALKERKEWWIGSLLQ
ncbi:MULTISPECIES: SGNH/GDSL hydrolase family protein [Geobacillus]|uniref:GDSL family lipase n=1 Tax=Geobacillus thermocatenulatus TaxID=33938 RepID=A0A226Q0N1_9BACL|nr:MULTISPECIES: SGNH/GDSL hydrolase family protein [Geobacillus]ASS99449.1 GDSL family lipase [Geobacillus thermocatenulatus]KLR73084.1 GDSL family lipase [Geobacillus sp. T6]KPC99260.1 Spore germination lipase LipC [Geobacillus sp. BCO2]OXB85851.1 GDSL family lipase [Geobacillus thermocatenulatus]